MNKFETYLEGRRVFALADLHLSLASPKPMDVFGAQWESHAERIAAAWRETVRPEDIVLVAGDISWAMKLEDAQADLDWIAALPGEKVFIKGNHDYWWNSLGKVRQAGGAGMHFIQNDCVRLGALAIGGTRMWDFPSVRWPGTVAVEEEKSPAEKNANKERGEDAEKIRERELNRLRLSLRRLEGILHLGGATHEPHSPAASSGARLDHHRVADLVRECDRLAQGADRPLTAGNDGYTRRGHRVARDGLMSHLLDRLGRRPDERNIARPAHLGELRVLRQESVSGVDRLGPRDLRGAYDVRGRQVARFRRGRSDADSLIGQLGMQACRVGLGVDRDGGDSHLLARADDTQCDFSSIGDEDLSKHQVSFA